MYFLCHYLSFLDNPYFPCLSGDFSEMHIVHGYFLALQQCCWPCNATQLRFMGVFYIPSALFQNSQVILKDEGTK